MPAGNNANGSILYVLSRDAGESSLSAIVGDPWEPNCTHVIRDDGIRQMTQVGDYVYIAGNDMRWGLRGYDWLYKFRHSDKTLAARMQIGGGTSCNDDVPEECTDHMWSFLSDGRDLFVVGSSWFVNVWVSSDAGQNWTLDASWASTGGGMARAYDVAKLGNERAVLVTMYEPAYPQICESALHFSSTGLYSSRPELSGLEPMPKKRLVSHDGAIVYPERSTGQLVVVHAADPPETLPLPFELPEDSHNWGVSTADSLYVVSGANEIWRLGAGGFELFANVPASHLCSPSPIGRALAS